MKQEKIEIQHAAHKTGTVLKDKLEHAYPLRFKYLIEKNIISPDDIKSAMARSKHLDKDVETILMNDFKIRKADIGTSIAQHNECKFVQYSENIFIPHELIKGINLSYLKKALWVPIALDGEKVIIATDNCRDFKLTEIPHFIKAKKFEFQIALKEDILKFIEAIKKHWDGKNFIMTEVAGELIVEEEEEEEDYTLNENIGIIVRLVNQIVIDGFERGASDIHIEPQKADMNTQIRFRIDGILLEYLKIPYSYTNALVSRIKIMSNLDISVKRLPQDGKIKFKYNNQVIELRVATIPSIMGEYVSMRIFTPNEPLSLNKLALSEWNYNKFIEIIKNPYGIVLVVGPTGSGKTTTVHSALAHLNNSERKIWTAEDPVEITQKGLCQVEVKPKINFNFAAALRSFLRADPDVIMIGEMRDLETASIGIEASLTGHLVLSTLHTNSAPETITRLIDIGIDSFNCADAILGILAQRLVRNLCKECKIPYHPDQKEFNFLVKAYGGKKSFSEFNIVYDDSLTLYKAKGCNACNYIG
ncbi:GspE/PulE family protein [Thermodesulfobacteriota bacterium]